MFDHDLWTPDEPREAAIALEMSRSGNFIVPHLAGKPFVEKPPLFYITASFFLKSLGTVIGNTAALRLVAVMAGLGTLLFTYLLGKLYFDRRKAFLAAAILAGTIGFTYITHRLIMDNLLMFFITASIWTLAKAYESKRFVYLLPAGLLTACAFLTKGLIGPVIIGLAWLGIFIPWINKCGRNAFVYCGIHLFSLIVSLSICAVWIVAFAVRGGPELFREWWWTNHFGRFSGQAILLGHIAPWYYYFGVLPLLLLPWLIPFAAGLILGAAKLFRKEPLPRGAPLFLAWTIGTFLLLSLSATKREIYLVAILPACALLSAYGLEAGNRLAKWANRLYILWISLIFISLGALAVAPFMDLKFLPVSLRRGWPQAFAFGALLAGALILLRRKAPFIQRFLLVILIGHAALLAIILPAIDQIKSYGPAFRAMAGAIGKNPEAKIAAWNFDETTRAGFYYYGGLILPPAADEQTLNNILQGRDNRYNAVVRLIKNGSANDLPGRENKVIFESRMGRRRLLQLIAAPDL